MDLRKHLDKLRSPDLFFAFTTAMDEVCPGWNSTNHSDGRVVAVTSIAAGDGKSTVALALARDHAADIGPVLLVDAAPTSRASLWTLLAPGPGGDTVREEGPLRIQGPVTTAVAEVEAACLAAPATTLWNGSCLPAVTERLTAWKKHYPLLLLDTAPLCNRLAQLTLLRHCDATILVLDYGRHPRPQVQTYLEAMDGAGVRCLGVVINRRRFPIPTFLYNVLT